jgi:hypothetical protein
MSKKSDFDNILEECLARVLKGETVEACLASHPEHGGELGPLLRTALDARAATVIRPRREFRERAAYEFQAAIREMPSKEAGRPVFWRRRWISVLAGVVFVLLAGTGVVAASSSSLPDGPLYGVKLATETVWLALTPSDLGKAELYVKFTDRRVEEIIAMADRGKVQQINRTAARLDSQMIAMAGLTAPADAASMSTMGTIETAPHPMLATPAPTTTVASTTVPMVTSTTTTTTQAATTTPATSSTQPPVTVTIPPQTTATIQPPASTTTAQDQKAGIKAVPPQPPGAERYNSGAVPGEHAELKELLARSAAANTIALQEELEKAPESAREALERAIEIASMGYSQNLSNLGQ